MWLMLILSKSAREFFALLVSHVFNSFIAVILIVFGIRSIFSNSVILGISFLVVGLLIAGITVYFLSKSIRSLLKDIHDKETK